MTNLYLKTIIQILLLKSSLLMYIDQNMKK